jgi:hypothetical protein
VLNRPAEVDGVVEELLWIGDFRPNTDEQAESVGRQFSSP